MGSEQDAERRIAAATAAAARRLDDRAFRQIVEPCIQHGATSAQARITYTGSNSRCRIVVNEINDGFASIRVSVPAAGMSIDLVLAGEHLNDLREALGSVSRTPTSPPAAQDDPETEQDTPSSTVRSRGRRPVRPTKA